MTFGSFSDYKLKLLWNSWDIQEEWQFALSWIAVFLAVIVYQALHYVIYSVEAAMRKERIESSIIMNPDGDIELGHSSHSNVIAGGVQEGTYFLLGSKSRAGFQVRIIHAVLGGVSYGLAMLLMLVAMTYNPSLLLALMLGYAAGDFMFFRLSGSSPDSGCH